VTAVTVRCVVLLLALARVEAATAAAPRAAHIVLPGLFGDHMVLQQGRPLPVWGTADPGATLSVELAGQARQARVAANGRWQVRFDPIPAGGPYQLVVRGRETLVFHDVWVGEVWLASGQSNMEMPLDGWAQVENFAAEVAAADFPAIRLLQVEHRAAYRPHHDVVSAGWRPCTPESVKAFSAAAYFFGRMLHRELGVPIGLVQASWGGTVIEAWTAEQSLRRIPELRAGLRRVAARAEPADLEAARSDYLRQFAAWRAAIPQGDRGTAASPPWSAPGLALAGFKTMTLPTDWEDAGLPGLDGVVWFRKEIELPASWEGHQLELHLGRIDDADITYFDGERVGGEEVFDHPRVYPIPSRLVRAGRHTIAVRVLDWGGGGGLWGGAELMKLARDDGEALPLAGEWIYRVALDLRDFAPRPEDPDDPNEPTVLSNGMIEPLVPYALRGAIWYQGEGNVSRAQQYRRLFPLLIDDWRARWGEGDFPFLFVQLAGFGPAQPEPGESDWAELREAQAMALRRPNTAMAVAIDLGDAKDIHPRNKQEVGRRLALAALRSVYGRPVVASGPVFRDLRAAGRGLRLRFDQADGGLAARGGATPRGFAVAGADRHFHWAEARIEGSTVVVWSDAVPRPVAVRYGWAANPLADLVNGAGLPAAPFRSDRWPGVTENRR